MTHSDLSFSVEFDNKVTNCNETTRHLSARNCIKSASTFHCNYSALVDSIVVLEVVITLLTELLSSLSGLNLVNNPHQTAISLQLSISDI